MGGVFFAGMEEKELRKEAVAPFHRFLLDPDGIYPGEFTHVVSVILMFVLYSLLPDLMVHISRSA